MHPMFIFAVLLVNSLQSGKVLQAYTQQTELSHSNTNSAVSRQVYVACTPCQFGIHVVYFFNMWFGMVQHQKQFGCREGRKIG